MDSGISILVGVGLAAACGMRVFMPLLAMSIAAHTGMLEPGSAMAWIGTWPALLALSTATVVEVVAYYIPWLDNLLDTLATPAAALAGAAAAATVMLPTDAHFAPTWQWAGALLAGGGAAGAVQVTTVAARAISTATTGGTGNSVVATAENAGAAGVSLMFLIAPVLGAAMILTAGFLGYRWFARRSKSPAAVVAAAGPAAASTPVPTPRRGFPFRLLPRLRLSRG